MNSDGQNQAHLYEDQRKSLVKANRHRVSKAKQDLLDRLLSFAYQCKMRSGIAVVTNAESKTIRLKVTSSE